MTALLAPHVLLPVLGVMALLSAGWAVFRMRGARGAAKANAPAPPPGLGGLLGGLSNKPLAHTLLEEVAKIGEATQHKFALALLHLVFPNLGVLGDATVSQILNGFDGVILGGQTADPGADPEDVAVLHGALQALKQRRQERREQRKAA